MAHQRGDLNPGLLSGNGWEHGGGALCECSRDEDVTLPLPVPCGQHDIWGNAGWGTGHRVASRGGPVLAPSEILRGGLTARHWGELPASWQKTRSSAHWQSLEPKRGSRSQQRPGRDWPVFWESEMLEIRRGYPWRMTRAPKKPTGKQGNPALLGTGPGSGGCQTRICSLIPEKTSL